GAGVAAAGGGAGLGAGFGADFGAGFAAGFAAGGGAGAGLATGAGAAAGFGAGAGCCAAGWAGDVATGLNTGAAVGRGADSPASEDPCATGASLSLEESIIGIPLRHPVAPWLRREPGLSWQPWQVYSLPKRNANPADAHHWLSGGDGPTDA